MRFALTVLVGLFLAPHLNYQDALVAILPATLVYDFARRQQRLIPLFLTLIVIATFLPPILIFTGYFRIPQWTWPLPLILCLIIVCVHLLWRRGDGSEPANSFVD